MQQVHLATRIMFQPNSASLPTEKPPRSSLCVACLHFWWQLFLKSIPAFAAHIAAPVLFGKLGQKRSTTEGRAGAIQSSSAAAALKNCKSIIVYLHGLLWLVPSRLRVSFQNVWIQKYSSSRMIVEIFGNAPLSLKRFNLLLGSLQWVLRQNLAAPGVPSAQLLSKLVGHLCWKFVFGLFGFSARIVGSIMRTITSRCIQQVLHSHRHRVAAWVIAFPACYQ